MENIAQTDYYPASVPAERSILGSCIESPRILDAVLAEDLRPEHFSVSDHRTLWQAILEMCDQGLPVDLVSLAEYRPEIEGAVLAELTFGVVVEEAHALHHVRILKNKARLRDLLRLGDWVIEEACIPGADPDGLVTELSVKISAMERHE